MWKAVHCISFNWAVGDAFSTNENIVHVRQYILNNKIFTGEEITEEEA